MCIAEGSFQFNSWLVAFSKTTAECDKSKKSWRRIAFYVVLPWILFKMVSMWKLIAVAIIAEKAKQKKYLKEEVEGGEEEVEEEKEEEEKEEAKEKEEEEGKEEEGEKGEEEEEEEKRKEEEVKEQKEEKKGKEECKEKGMKKRKVKEEKKEEVNTSSFRREEVPPEPCTRRGRRVKRRSRFDNW